jgi:hypothetical protein
MKAIGFGRRPNLRQVAASEGTRQKLPDDKREKFCGISSGDAAAAENSQTFFVRDRNPGLSWVFCGRATPTRGNSEMKKLTLSLAAILVAAPIGGALAAETLTAADKSMAVTAITGVKTELDELKKLTDVKEVKVVTIDSTMSSDTELSSAMTQSASDIALLRSAIEANAKLKAQLDTDKIEADKIVGADVASDGSVTIYVKGT